MKPTLLTHSFSIIMKCIYTTSLLFLATVSFAQNHTTFKIGQACDSASIAKELIGTWVDTASPMQSLIIQGARFEGALIYISIGKNYSLLGNWWIDQNSKPTQTDSTCIFYVYFVPRGADDLVADQCTFKEHGTYLIRGTNTKYIRVYKRKP